MNGRKKCVLFFALLMVLLGAHKGESFIIINELLADPATGLAGDANGDGLSSSTNDEFVELLNYGNSSVNISGWSIKDAISTRHIFPTNTILSPYEYLVVFGGGSVNLPGAKWQLASSGGLSLNNTAETVTLVDGSLNLIDQVIYGSIASHDQSIVRSPEGAGALFVLHTSVPESQGRLFSPGTSASGQPLAETTTVPEWPTLVLLSFGLISLKVFRIGLNEK